MWTYFDVPERTFKFSIQDGETALHKASGGGHTAVITLLLDHGADVHVVTEVGDCGTALGVQDASHGCFTFGI